MTCGSEESLRMVQVGPAHTLFSGSVLHKHGTGTLRGSGLHFGNNLSTCIRGIRGGTSRLNSCIPGISRSHKVLTAVTLLRPRRDITIREPHLENHLSVGSPVAQPVIRNYLPGFRSPDTEL